VPLLATTPYAISISRPILTKMLQVGSIYHCLHFLAWEFQFDAGLNIGWNLDAAFTWNPAAHSVDILLVAGKSCHSMGFIM